MYTSMMRRALFGSGDTALLSLDFTTGTMPTAVTFKREDTTARATYIDASGYVKTVTAAGDPRFDYTGGVAKGLLIEAAATNSCRQSSNPASWLGASSGATITTGTGLAPDNLTTPKQIALTSGAYHYQYSPTSLIAATYILSVWLKASSTQSVGIRICRTADGAIKGMITATVTTSWQRFEVSFTSNATDTIDFGFDQRNFGAGSSVVGPAVAATFLMWGAQLELGSTASSNIETTTAALTRLADDAVIRSTAWTSLYAQPGAMVVEFYRGAYGTGDRSILSTDPTAARHWHLKQANASATAQIAYSTGSATTQTGLTAGLNKVAIAWNAPSPTASFDLCVNGATPTFGGSNVGTTLSTWLTLGSQSTTGVSGSGTWDGYLNNSIKSVKYYTGLTYAEMQAKTT